MSMNNYINDLMSKINAFKMHGLGNQFLIIDRRNKNIELSKHQIQKISSN